MDLGIAELLLFVVCVVFMWLSSTMDDRASRTVRIFTAAMAFCFVTVGFVLWLGFPPDSGSAQPASGPEFLVIGVALLAAQFGLG